jgi:hypothetical protein
MAGLAYLRIFSSGLRVQRLHLYCVRCQSLQALRNELNLMKLYTTSRVPDVKEQHPRMTWKRLLFRVVL